MKTYLHNIINILTEDFIIKDNYFKLKSLICTPYSGHYTTILIGIFKNKHLFDKNFNYIYDDLDNDNNIVSVVDWKKFLDNHIPFIAIYGKNFDN